MVTKTVGCDGCGGVMPNDGAVGFIDCGQHSLCATCRRAIICPACEREMESSGPAGAAVVRRFVASSIEASEQRKEDMKRFFQLVNSRLEVGAQCYGEKSFSRPSIELLDEVLEEVADICGWSAVLAARLLAVRRALATDEARALDGLR